MALILPLYAIFHWRVYSNKKDGKHKLLSILIAIGCGFYVIVLVMYYFLNS